MTFDEFQRLAATPARNSYWPEKAAQLAEKWTGPATHIREDMNHSWWAMQRDDEFWPLLKLVSDLDPKRIIEVGTSQGGTAVFWDHMVGPDGVVVTIELNEDGRLLSMFKPEYCQYKPVSSLHVLQRDSQTSETAAIVAGLMDHQPVDFVFIDGEHSFAGAGRDHARYWPMLRSGGLMAFHDARTEPGIISLMEHLGAEILPRVGEHDFGYGVLRRP